jgi:2-octaprenyl-6-methoxyphenol hydroxylase
LNLGLRDGAEIAGLVGAAINAGEDIGSDKVLAAYTRARSLDVSSRTWVIDGFNRALLAEAGPLGPLAHAARAVGLTALSAFAPLRRLVMQAGLEPLGGRPKLMTPREGSAER